MKYLMVHYPNVDGYVELDLDRLVAELSEPYGIAYCEIMPTGDLLNPNGGLDDVDDEFGYVMPKVVLTNSAWRTEVEFNIWDWRGKRKSELPYSVTIARMHIYGVLMWNH